MSLYRSYIFHESRNNIINNTNNNNNGNKNDDNISKAEEITHLNSITGQYNDGLSFILFIYLF